MVVPSQAAKPGPQGRNDHVVLKLAARASGGQSRRFPCKSTLRLIHRPAQTLTSTKPPRLFRSASRQRSVHRQSPKNIIENGKGSRISVRTTDLLELDCWLQPRDKGTKKKNSDNSSPNSARAGKVKSQTPKVEAQGAYFSNCENWTTED